VVAYSLSDAQTVGRVSRPLRRLFSLNTTDLDQSTGVLSRIVSARLTSVDFVLDYLILGFDERGALTTLVWPEVTSNNKTLRFGMEGYRDQLCDLIGQIVSDAIVSQDETITISFGDRDLRIPLREKKASGERAIFKAPKHFLHIW
jgi:hypothetical protein